ncbi:MAG: PSD1 and planctomycete cytochrome C domain-containing protein [Planctomycetaceae bacterium]
MWSRRSSSDSQLFRRFVAFTLRMKHVDLRRGVVLALALAVGVMGLRGSLLAEERIDFTADIRPILSNSCFNCHGPDEKTREANLRLDTSIGALADHDGHAAIVPGKPEASELLNRITSNDPDLRMPPADSGRPSLTPAQQQLLRRWIEQGAEYKGHWAFETPQRPALPNVAEALSRGDLKVPMTQDATKREAERQRLAAWPRNAIDHFTLKRMLEAGLTPAAEASKETLIRRATLDLTGLPPTVAEVDAFLADDSPEAYEKLIDRLLASTRYGEHMTRYWLDAARYGDTHGLHLDNIRSIWPYRDWLIRSFNDNKPYDEMTIEQLAGDLLPNPTTQQKVATGFIRCNVTTSEGGSIAEEYYVRYGVDRVETMATVYMGLTLGCAVCHDHKFDPFTQKEFYGLFAFYNSFKENPMDGNALLPPPILEVPSVDQEQKQAELNTLLASIKVDYQEALSRIEYVDPFEGAEPKELERQDYVWIEDGVPEGANAQQSGHPWEFVSAPAPVYSGEKATKRTGTGIAQHFFTDAKNPLIIGEGDTLFAWVYLDPQNLPKSIMLQWNDGKWEHRAYWGGNEIDWGTDNSPSRLRVGDLPAAGQWVKLEVSAEKVGLPAGTKVNGWAFTQFDGTVYWDHAGLNTRTPQEGLPYKSQRQWELAMGDGKSLPKPVQEALKVAVDKRTEPQLKTLRDHFLEHVYPDTRELLAPLLARKSKAEAELKAVNDSIAKTMIVEELPQPKEAYVLIRGEYDKKGEPVVRHTPASLPSFPEGAPLNRLGLAQWLVHRDHPLTSRVTVNRWWQRYFGTGIVKTAEDFGNQGELPSHPQLLDWLAVELMEEGWNVKQMQKLMLMSATYRQSAVSTPHERSVDPYNRLLSHGPRFRLDGESIRDTALFVSGLLNEEVGGPSVKPYQPAGLWEAVGYTDSNTAKFTQDDGEKLYRRSMYTFWKRTSPPPSLAMLDAPSRENCTVRRARTNTPLQALALMNDKQFIETARHFAQRILHDGGTTDAERLTWAFRTLLSRRPTDRELDVLTESLASYQGEFAASPESATQLIDSATTLMKPRHLDRDKSQDPTLAAWTLLANLLLNLDEAVTKG